LKALGFFVQEGWSSLRRNPAASLAAVTALAAVLFVLLLLLLISHNILFLAGRLEARKGLSVFLDPTLPPERVAELRRHFEVFPEVQALRFTSRAEALADVESDLGTSQIEEILGGNPLPDTFLITPSPTASDAASMERLANEIAAYEGIDDVVYGRRWIEALDQGLRMVYQANGLTGGLATLAIILVLGNTLRLLVLMREDQLYVMKVIGATDAFLRAPFVAAGALLCLIGAVCALAFLYGGFHAGRVWLPGMRFLPLQWLAFFLLGVGFIGVTGSWVTVQATLHQLERRGESRHA
jgi:cell division transport system permease protein